MRKKVKNGVGRGLETCFVAICKGFVWVRLRRCKINRLIHIGTFIFVRDRRGSDLQNPTYASLFTLNYEVKNPFQIFCPTCARIRLRRVRLRRVLLYNIYQSGFLLEFFSPSPLDLVTKFFQVQCTFFQVQHFFAYFKRSNFLFNIGTLNMVK